MTISPRRKTLEFFMLARFPLRIATKSEEEAARNAGETVGLFVIVSNCRCRCEGPNSGSTIEGNFLGRDSYADGHLCWGTRHAENAQTAERAGSYQSGRQSLDGDRSALRRASCGSGRGHRRPGPMVADADADARSAAS